jgi:hypothetical protein
MEGKMAAAIPDAKRTTKILDILYAYPMYAICPSGSADEKYRSAIGEKLSNIPNNIRGIINLPKLLILESVNGSILFQL